MPDPAFVYVPCLKGKDNDLGAFNDLGPADRTRIKPLVEPRPVPSGGSIIEHLNKLGADLKKHYPSGPLFVDFISLNGLALPDGSLAVTAGLTMLDRPHTPVWGLQRDDRIWDILKQRAHAHDGLCIRVDVDDMDDASENTWHELLERTAYVGVPSASVDILVDLRDVREKDASNQKNTVLDFLSHKPFANKYRSIIVAGSSALKSVHPLIPRDDVGEVGRNELITWLMLQADIGDSITLVYGDYGVIHPDFTELSGGSNANAKIRYTSGGKIVYFRGHGLYKPSRFSQYRALAAKVMQSKVYCGKDFSRGDRRIHDCANNLCGTGNLGNWVHADMNHHMQYTIRQLDRLIAASRSIRDDQQAAQAITDLA